MWRFDRLEPEDSLLEDDDEWLDDAIAIVSAQVGFFLCASASSSPSLGVSSTISSRLRFC